MSAQEYLALRAAYPAKKKVPKRQQESILQKEMIRFLNGLNIGFFYRVRNGGQWDPTRKTFRKNAELVAVSDIVGWNKNGRAVYIEVKRTSSDVDKKKKLIFSVKITDAQKEFLLRAHKHGCISGVAFTEKDCLNIVMDDPVRFPRHPRTYLFLPRPELEEYGEKYRELLAEHAKSAQDPVIRHVKWASGSSD